MAIRPPDLVPADKEEFVNKQHQTDSITILMLLGLLLLTILTVWLFKYKRFRFVHETGLSMVYGLIIGAIIRYTNVSTKEVAHAMIVNETFYAVNPPEHLYVSLAKHVNSTENVTIKYDVMGTVSKPQEDGALEETVTFDPELFFNVLLPLIIFEAGYSMKRRHFFKNLGAIIMYAFIGTTVSCLVVGGILYGLTSFMSSITFSLNDCFFFGAVISATDPVTVLAIFHDLHVDVDLYAIIFGESVLNDAVAIVLSGSVEKYGSLQATTGFSAEAFFKSLGNFLGIFAGAFAIGSAIGCFTALLTKFTKIRDFPLLETALFFLMSYSSFQAAESAGFTGIVAVLFCGITQAHYTQNNLSAESKTRTKELFQLTGFLSENFVFLYIGVSIFTFQYQKWHAGFIFSALFASVAARAFNVYPLSFLLNLGRTNKIRLKFQHMMMFSGLRGAIAFALSIRNTSTDSRQLMVPATMIIVLSTVIVCGCLTTPMLQWLQISVGVDEDLDLQNVATVRSAIEGQRQYRSMDSPVTEQHTSHNSTGPPLGQSEESPTEPSSPLLDQSMAKGYTSLNMLLASSLLRYCVPRNPKYMYHVPPEESQPGPKKPDKAWLVAKWHHFDVLFMKPLLTNSRPSLLDTLPKCCFPLAKIFTTEEQLSQGELKADSDSDTDMIIDNTQMSIGGSSEIIAPSANNHTAEMQPNAAEIEMARTYSFSSDDQLLTP
ncbi:sodium/hydrogen exchanger 9-like isoform X2 [Gigantopelta aegis]|uniref:sodium/hydrogen exchanger 9-like isoform X2 n=1 Tax=Gigantopelta aegis TaxID=1735272 RepID=UPI001B887DBC|nr:sodium/hydrogen exchanger 9-like isoform X2 [Gigantopelta aegis]